MLTILRSLASACLALPMRRRLFSAKAAYCVIKKMHSMTAADGRGWQRRVEGWFCLVFTAPLHAARRVMEAAAVLTHMT